MALAQPTNLQAQLLEPLITLEQKTERLNVAPGKVRITTGGDRRVTTSGDVRITTPGSPTLFAISQVVVPPGATYYPETTLVTFDQTVLFITETARETLVTLSQSVRRHVDARRLVLLRQSVFKAATAAQIQYRVYLDDKDVTLITARDMTITASAGDNRTARLYLRLPKGPVNITSFQGRRVEIHHMIDGQLRALFTGFVDRPVYQYEQRRIELRCSDLRAERLGRVSRSVLRNLTGGLFSPVTQREDAEGEAWVTELMRTVEGSLDYNGGGSIQYRPWQRAVAPRYTLTRCDIRYEDVKFEFATRSEIINRVKGVLEYRWFQRNTITDGVSVSMRRALDGTGLPRAGDVIPTKQTILSALRGVSGWIVSSGTTTAIPADGWYRPTLAGSKPIGFSVSSAFRSTRAMGGGVSLKKYISQPKRETYEFTISAPESVDQFGAIEGGDFRYAAESLIDPAVFEDRGCSVGPEDDRRADVNLAMQALQAIAAKQIRAGHRQNFVEFPARGGILPVEIGDIVQVTTNPVTALGWVSEFTHTVRPNGDDDTTIKLALSRVDSSLVVTEDWTLPAAPSSYQLNAESLLLPETPDCPPPDLGDVSGGGRSRIEPDGTVVITAPPIDRRVIDEIVGKRTQGYDVEIPRDQFIVEVT